MKSIKFTILAFLLGCSICSLNAQMEIFPDGSMHVGNTATSHAKINVSGTAVQIGNTATPNSAIKANSDGTLHFGNVTTPALKVNPDGVVNIGRTGFPQIKINSNGNVSIDNTNTILFNADAFELNIPQITIATTVWDPGSILIGGNGKNVGFEFIPSIDEFYAPSSQGYAGYIYKKSVMALTGLSSSDASIGTLDNNMGVVYSYYYYSNGNYIGTLASSDLSLKTNIRKISPISEKVLKLNPVMYDFIKTGTGKDVSENPAYKDRVGFIAQEVLDIFPDLVVKDANDIYRLDYAGLIPYLTKALQEQAQSIQKQNELMLAQEKINKEQHEIIEKLQGQINDIQKGIYTADFIIEGKTAQPNKAPQKDGADNALYQNAPNPFNISTTIKYQLSDNTTNAKICIYNLTGKQLQCYNLPTAKGESSIEVRASSLQAGMYLYSLIVDDKLIDTKRMVLTE